MKALPVMAKTAAAVRTIFFIFASIFSVRLAACSKEFASFDNCDVGNPPTFSNHDVVPRGPRPGA
jgi:hypothetical protein